MAHLLSAFVSLLSLLLFSRLLSADGYGFYATVLALVAVVETAGFSWLQSSIVRLYPVETDRGGCDQFAAAVRVGFALSALLVVIASLIAVAALRPSAEYAVLGLAGLLRHFRVPFLAWRGPASGTRNFSSIAVMILRFTIRTLLVTYRAVSTHAQWLNCRRGCPLSFGRLCLHEIGT